jgi:hypothetical protein
VESKDTQTEPRPASVGKAWAWLLVFTGGMTLIGFLAWGSLSAAPSWFHALFGFQTLWAVVGLVNAYKRRAEQEAGQPPE